MDIEDLLRWAFRDELPKLAADEGGSFQPQQSHPMWRNIAQGGRVDFWSREPGFPSAMGDPHPDALVVAQAVADLTREDLDLSDFLISYRLGPDFNSQEILEGEAASFAGWIVTRAKLGGRPDLGEEREVEPVKSITGQITVWSRHGEWYEEADETPIFVEHEMPTKPIKGGVYKPGSYCKVRYLPTCREVARDRAVYAVWWAGLAALVVKLDGRLASISVTAPAAARRPWFGDEQPVPAAVHRDLGPDRTVLDPVRPVAPRPMKRSQHGPVHHLDLKAA